MSGAGVRFPLPQPTGPMPNNDPRVYFAAERTLLAWVRTALGIIGLGFVVARFGLFLRIVHSPQNGEPGQHLPAVALGMTLSLMGSAIAALAAWQHQRFCRTLGSTDLPSRYKTQVGPAFGFGVAAAGAVLAVELLL